MDEYIASILVSSVSYSQVHATGSCVDNLTSYKGNSRTLSVASPVYFNVMIV